MKKWNVNYGDNRILIENEWNREALFVNGELQDERLGGFRTESRLYGKLPTGELIKVSLGGTFTIKCRIFIDNKLVPFK